MSEGLKVGFVKFISKFLILVYHTILLAVYILCSWGLEKLLKLLGFENGTFSTWIENYDPPVVLLTLSCIFIVTMFGDYIPKKKSDDRFVMVMDDQANVIKQEVQIAPIVDNKEKNDIYQ